MKKTPEINVMDSRNPDCKYPDCISIQTYYKVSKRDNGEKYHDNE